MIHHVSLGVGDYERAKRFYDKVLATLGYGRVYTLDEFNAAAYGPEGRPTFWVGYPENGEAAGVGTGVHICFSAPSEQAVDSFHQTALDGGGADAGAPGPRPHYGPDYYGAFVRDPDGNKIEAVCFAGQEKS